jgi:hypothetical protein
LFTDIFPSAASMTSTHHSFDCTLCTFTVQEDEERLAGLTDSDVLKVQEAAGAALAEANERLLEAELRVQAAQVKPLTAQQITPGLALCLYQTHMLHQLASTFMRGALLVSSQACATNGQQLCAACGTTLLVSLALSWRVNGWIVRRSSHVMSQTLSHLCSSCQWDSHVLQAAQRQLQQQLQAAEQLQQDIEALKTENLEAWRQKYELESQLATVRATMEGMQGQACSMQKVGWVRALYEVSACAVWDVRSVIAAEGGGEPWWRLAADAIWRATGAMRRVHRHGSEQPGLE